LHALRINRGVRDVRLRTPLKNLVPPPITLRGSSKVKYPQVAIRGVADPKGA
jgi:hypothetical protein